MSSSRSNTRSNFNRNGNDDENDQEEFNSTKKQQNTSSQQIYSDNEEEQDHGLRSSRTNHAVTLLQDESHSNNNTNQNEDQQQQGPMLENFSRNASQMTTTATRNNNNSECCSGLLQYKYEIIIIFTLLSILVLPAYFIGKLVHTDFRFHDQCRDCFRINPVGYVFDQRDAQCLFYANVSSVDPSITPQNEREYLVFTPDYCGAPECQSRDLIPGVRSVPYWLMFVSCIFGIVTSTFANIIKDCVRSCRNSKLCSCCGCSCGCSCCQNGENEDDENKGLLSHQHSPNNNNLSSRSNQTMISDVGGGYGTGSNNNNNQHHLSLNVDPYNNNPNMRTRSSRRNKSNKKHYERIDLITRLDKAIEKQPSDSLCRLRFLLRATRSFGMIDPYYYTLLYLFTIGHFIYIVYHVCTNPTYASQNAWHKYQTSFSFWLNSGTIEVICFLHSQLLVAIFVDNAMKEFSEEAEWVFSAENCGRGDGGGGSSNLQRIFEVKEFELSIYAPFVAYTRPDHRHYRGKDPKTAFLLHLFPPFLIPFIFTHIIAAVIIFLPMAILWSVPFLFMWKIISAYSGEGSDAEEWRRLSHSRRTSRRGSRRSSSSGFGRGQGVIRPSPIVTGTSVANHQQQQQQRLSDASSSNKNNNNHNNFSASSTPQYTQVSSASSHHSQKSGNSGSGGGGGQHSSSNERDDLTTVNDNYDQYETSFSLIHTFITTRGSPLKLYSWLFFLRLVGGFVFLCTLQALTNYAILFYSGNYTWAECVKYDFIRRDTRCYANAFVNKVEVYNVQLATWIFS